MRLKFLGISLFNVVKDDYLNLQILIEDQSIKHQAIGQVVNNFCFDSLIDFSNQATGKGNSSKSQTVKP